MKAVTCYDAVTAGFYGSMLIRALLQCRVEEGPRPRRPSIAAMSSPCATGVLSCLDAATGQRVCPADVLKENQINNLEWGVSASPLVFEAHGCRDRRGDQWPTLLAYDARAVSRSGSREPTRPVLVAHSHDPRRAARCSFRQCANVTAHDPATGAVLLDFHWTDDKWPKAAQPVVLPGDRIFLSAGYGLGALLLEVKAARMGSSPPRLSGRASG